LRGLRQPNLIEFQRFAVFFRLGFRDVTDYYLWMAHIPVLIGSDHRGFALKAKCIEWLRAHDFEVQDLGTHSEERCDALDAAKSMAEGFKNNPNQFGILICGSGQAMTMTANRYRNIRAALCATPEMAKITREHNDANVITIGADFVTADVALQCVEIFLATKFLGGRYAERRDRLTALGGL
jgi:ribose 5-phosphate isomerase B